MVSPWVEIRCFHGRERKPKIRELRIRLKLCSESVWACRLRLRVWRCCSSFVFWFFASSPYYSSSISKVSLGIMLLYSNVSSKCVYSSSSLGSEIGLHSAATVQMITVHVCQTSRRIGNGPRETLIFQPGSYWNAAFYTVLFSGGDPKRMYLQCDLPCFIAFHNEIWRNRFPETKLQKRHFGVSLWFRVSRPRHFYTVSP